MFDSVWASIKAVFEIVVLVSPDRTGVIRDAYKTSHNGLLRLGIAVGGMWFAANWAAWHLGFHPRVDAPLVEPSAGAEAHLVWNRLTVKEV